MPLTAHTRRAGRIVRAYASEVKPIAITSSCAGTEARRARTALGSARHDPSMRRVLDRYARSLRSRSRPCTAWSERGAGSSHTKSRGVRAAARLSRRNRTLRPWNGPRYSTVVMRTPWRATPAGRPEEPPPAPVGRHCAPSGEDRGRHETRGPGRTEPFGTVVPGPPRPRRPRGSPPACRESAPAARRSCPPGAPPTTAANPGDGGSGPQLAPRTIRTNFSSITPTFQPSARQRGKSRSAKSVCSFALRPSVNPPTAMYASRETANVPARISAS